MIQLINLELTYEKLINNLSNFAQGVTFKHILRWGQRQVCEKVQIYNKKTYTINIKVPILKKLKTLLGSALPERIAQKGKHPIKGKRDRNIASEQLLELKNKAGSLQRR